MVLTWRISLWIEHCTDVHVYVTPSVTLQSPECVGFISTLLIPNLTFVNSHFINFTFDQLSFTLSTHFVSIELMQWEVDKVTNDSLGSYQIYFEQYALQKNSNLYTKLIRVASLERHRKM